MALNLIPGVGEVTAPISAGVNVGRDVVGEDNYQKARGGLTWSASAWQAFVPINPFLWPVQAAMMIIFILIFIFAFDFSFGGAFIGAFFTQAIIIMIISHWFLDKFLKFGLGI